MVENRQLEHEVIWQDGHFREFSSSSGLRPETENAENQSRVLEIAAVVTVD
jgi:hypothetical protein